VKVDFASIDWGTLVNTLDPEIAARPGRLADVVHVNRPGRFAGLAEFNSRKWTGSMMSIAKHSLSPLQKARFDVAYEKAVHGLSGDNQPTVTSRHGVEPSS
jgi:hypothetical protein